MANIFVRHEKKFLINQEQMNLILDKFGSDLVLDEFCQDEGFSYINNIYFDTPGNDVIRESVSRPIYKEKLRLRSYSILKSDEENAYLEIKKKYDGIGNKRRIKLKYKDAMDFVLNKTLPSFDDYVSKEIALEINEFLKRNEVIPAIFISSKRKAFYGKDDKDFRLTFDFDVKYRRDNVSLLDGYGTNFLENGQIIMEVKFKDSIPFDFIEFLSNLGIYKTRFSKYGKIYEKELKNKYKEN